MHPLRKTANQPEAGWQALGLRLSQAPLSLDFALRCATDVAATLRELHEDGCIHGEVGPESVLIGPCGAVLLPGQPSGDADCAADIAAFGATLAMMVGPAGSRGRLSPLSRGGTRLTPDGLCAAALQLAGKCSHASSGLRLTMQNILTELRLLALQARQVMPRISEPQPVPVALPRPIRPADPAPQAVLETKSSLSSGPVEKFLHRLGIVL